jgi:hypothetical protein
MTIRDPSSQEKYPHMWTHVKTGKNYVIISFGIIEKTMQPSVIYSEYTHRDQVWVRPCSEFFDGRFTPNG